MYIKNKRAMLLGLFMECPMGTAVEKCPAVEIRKLSVEDRVAIVNGVNEEVVDRLFDQHRICMAARESGGTTRANRAM